MKDSFVAATIHELRSPLCTVMLGLELLLKKFESARKLSEEGNVYEILQDINISCTLAINTVNDLLAFDKMENNMMEISKKLMNPYDLVTSCVRLFDLQAHAQGVKIALLFDEAIGPTSKVRVDVDSIKMQTVIRNYTSNALKFSKSGSAITVEVRVVNESNGSGVLRVSVTDQGVGIAASDIPKLFQQYKQINPDKIQGGKGSGIGLWLSKFIVESHGGSVGAFSKGEGQGSTFTFDLPFVESLSMTRPSSCEGFQSFPQNVSPSKAVADFIVPSSSSSQSNSSSANIGTKVDIDARKALDRKANILAVDDSLLILKMVERSFKECSHVISLTTSGVEAISMIKDKLDFYDVVLVDCYMPEMLGPEVVSAIRAAGYGGVIFGLTGSSNREDVDLFMKAGCNAVLEKPLSLATYKNALDLETEGNMNSSRAMTKP